MLIIPAIDILGGKCVRLLRGDFENSTVYSDDPVSVARDWERQGAPMLHVVDLDGAMSGKPANFELILKIVVAVEIKDGKIATEGLQKSSRVQFDDFLHELKKLGVDPTLFTYVPRDG